MRPAAAVVAAAVACCLLAPAAAQMVSPLQGQNVPTNTSTMYFSFYLDRLLAVDEVGYRTEMLAYFYFSWTDPTAFATVQQRTAAMLAGGGCELQCSDQMRNQSCCDGIYVPSFTFRFPQDRPTSTRLVLLPDGSVAWTTYVQAIFFQPMKLQNFPSDSWDLLIDLEFADSTPLGQPGVEIVASSGGSTLQASGKGDAVSQWSINGVSVKVIETPAVFAPKLFKTFSQIQSAPGDPLGLTNTNASQLRTAPPGPLTWSPIYPVERNTTRIQILIRISRFFTYHIINTLLPVLILGLLSFIVFALERSDLSNRLGLIVTLFLAMAAVQWVVSENQPASSYVLPTQQASLATYVLLAFIALDSIIVYRVETRQEREKRRVQQQKAHEEWLAHQEEHSGGGGSGAAGEPGDTLPTKQPHEPAHVEQQPAATGSSGANGRAGNRPSRGWLHRLACCGGAARSGMDRAGAALHPHRSPQQDAWLALRIDRCALAFLLIGYCVTIILIFTLQSGYINLFG